jgi:hypothetical protein
VLRRHHSTAPQPTDRPWRSVGLSPSSSGRSQRSRGRRPAS